MLITLAQYTPDSVVTYIPVTVSLVAATQRCIYVRRSYRIKVWRPTRHKMGQLGDVCSHSLGLVLNKVKPGQ